MCTFLKKKPRKIGVNYSTIVECTPVQSAFFILLEIIYSQSCVEEVPITVEQLCFLYYGTYSPDSRTKKMVREALDGLPILKKVDKYYILRPSCFTYEDEQFIQINIEDYEKLYRKPKLLKHFLLIVKMRSYGIEVDGKRGKICVVPISRFCELEDVSYNTICSYNKELEDLGLICVGRSNYDKGEESREVNSYSLYEDKHLLDKYTGYYEGDNSKANFRRRVAAKYNSYLADPSRYTPEELEVFRAELNEYNQQMIELGKTQPDYLKKVKLLD